LRTEDSSEDEGQETTVEEKIQQIKASKQERSSSGGVDIPLRDTQENLSEGSEEESSSRKDSSPSTTSKAKEKEKEKEKNKDKGKEKEKEKKKKKKTKKETSTIKKDRSIPEERVNALNNTSFRIPPKTNSEDPSSEAVRERKIARARSYEQFVEKTLSQRNLYFNKVKEKRKKKKEKEAQEKEKDKEEDFVAKYKNSAIWLWMSDEIMIHIFRYITSLSTY